MNTLKSIGHQNKFTAIFFCLFSAEYNDYMENLFICITCRFGTSVVPDATFEPGLSVQLIRERIGSIILNVTGKEIEKQYNGCVPYMI